MKAAIDRRETGIPGSDADGYIEKMGGPITQRASRTVGTGPAPMTFGQRPRGPRQDAMEESAITDVLPETEADDADEWKPVRTPRSEVRRRLAEQNARSAQAAPESRASGKLPPTRRRTDDLPRERQRRPLSGRVALLVGALALIALYLVTGWLYSAWVGVSNRLSYGPTPTSYLEAVVGDHDAPGHPTWVMAMNEHGTIVIQIAPGGDFSKAVTYTVAAQTFHAWGNLDDVTVSLTVAGTGPTPNIEVRLQGDPDLSHFYLRPSVAFLLLNQRPGFKVGPVEP